MANSHDAQQYGNEPTSKLSFRAKMKKEVEKKIQQQTAHHTFQFLIFEKFKIESLNDILPVVQRYYSSVECLPGPLGFSFIRVFLFFFFLCSSLNVWLLLISCNAHFLLIHLSHFNK